MGGRSTSDTIQLLEKYTRELWGLTIVFFGGGDIITTAIGWTFSETVELGPLAAILFHRFGLGIMIPLKLAMFVIAWGLWKLVPAPHRLGVPLGLATFGVLLTLWNTTILLAVIAG